MTGWYREQVVPRAIDVVCRLGPAADLRRRVCTGLTGDVVEIGFGSGLNVPHYPPAVRSVAAVEPSEVAWRVAGRRVAASPVPVRRGGLDGQRLPFDDASFDSALSTWTVCTIPDPVAALREVRRVLRPGGVLRFIEHGLAPHERVRRWQRRLDPLQQRLAGGCHLTRDAPELMRQAGLELVEVEQLYEPVAPKWLGAAWIGSARPA